MSNEPQRLRIQTAREGMDVIVRLTDDVDLRTSPDLRDRLLEALGSHPSRLIIDLSGVPYMDSSGVGTLVDMKRRTERDGSAIILVGLQPRVRSVFEITRLDGFFTIVETLEEAREA
jgi:anti-sigma B factor antagonist